MPLDAAGFRHALRKLDLERGDALGTLTEAEVQMIISSCDRDGDNCVDGQEWCDRFGAALRRLRGEGTLTDVADASGDLHVAHSRLLPDCLEAGRWLKLHAVLDRWKADQPTERTRPRVTGVV